MSEERPARRRVSSWDERPEEFRAFMESQRRSGLVLPGRAPADSKPLLVFEHAPDPFVIPPIQWLVSGLWCAETHGELAGPEKTLKSYIGLILDVGLAAGLSVFDEFKVPTLGRVLHLAGEGGRSGYWRRLERVCAAYGVDVGDVRPNLRVTFRTASISNPQLVADLTKELETYAPTLTHLDPWYAFAPTQVDSRQLTEVGAALDGMGQLCAQAGSSLLINNHFNQTGPGNGLTRITGAGHAEWCDSWLLVHHREPADVAGGRFRLRLDVGSRQWSGNSWDLNLDIGRFNVLTGQHDGKITWNITQASGAVAVDPQATKDAKVVAAKVNILRVARRKLKPFQQTRLLKEVEGRDSDKAAAFEQLVDLGELVVVGTAQVASGSGHRSVPAYTVAP